MTSRLGLLIVAALVGATGAFAETPEVQRPWAYSREGGKVRTSRSHLMVLNPGQASEKRVAVRSDCEKPVETEASFGNCSHRVRIEPDGKELLLSTGEDVALAYFGGTLGEFPLFLGTVRYGCCGGPNQVSYYSPAGEFMGSLPTYAEAAPIIDSPVDLQNVGNHEWILLSPGTSQDLDGRSEYVVYRRAASGGYARQPLKLQLPLLKECVWTIRNVFVPQDGILDVQFALAECDEHEGEITARCALSKDSWSCSEGKEGPGDGAPSPMKAPASQ